MQAQRRFMALLIGGAVLVGLLGRAPLPVRAALGVGPDSSRPAPATTSAALAINAGGPEVPPFSADRFFGGLEQAPAGIATSTTASISTSGVVNPAPAAVYQTQRTSAGDGQYFVYQITQGLTEGAQYRLRLHFAELTATQPGQRQFNVILNGTQQVLTNFDIVAAAGGRNKAIVKEFIITARSPFSSTGYLYMRFAPGAAGRPVINGIELIPVTP